MLPSPCPYRVTPIEPTRPYLVFSLNHGVHWRIELVAALEERKGDDKEVLESDTAGFLDKLACSGGGTAGGDEVAGESAGVRIGRFTARTNGDCEQTRRYLA